MDFTVSLPSNSLIPCCVFPLVPLISCLTFPPLVSYLICLLLIKLVWNSIAGIVLSCILFPLDCHWGYPDDYLWQVTSKLGQTLLPHSKSSLHSRMWYWDPDLDFYISWVIYMYCLIFPSSPPGLWPLQDQRQNPVNSVNHIFICLNYKLLILSVA